MHETAWLTSPSHRRTTKNQKECHQSRFHIILSKASSPCMQINRSSKRGRLSCQGSPPVAATLHAAMEERIPNSWNLFLPLLGYANSPPDGQPIGFFLR